MPLRVDFHIVEPVNQQQRMNRIYQGRVTRAEILHSKDEQAKLLDLDVLWRHHELFHDAVN